MATELAMIRGLVIPAGWDEAGRVRSVAVSTFDEKEYLVENSPRADELLTVIHKEVEVVGWVRGIERGTPEIQLYEYRVIAASATA